MNSPIGRSSLRQEDEAEEVSEVAGVTKVEIVAVDLMQSNILVDSKATRAKFSVIIAANMGT